MGHRFGGHHRRACTWRLLGFADPNSLLRTFSLEDGGGGAEDAEGVQVQGAVGDVVVFQLQALLVLDIGTPVAAPPTREAWLHLVVEGAPSVGFQLAGDKRARADGGHVALQHVEELGQLVQGSSAQHTADRRDARVMGELLVLIPLGAYCGVFQEPLQLLVGVPYHGAQLPQLEALAAQPHTGLLVEDGVGVAGGQVRQLHDGGHGQGDKAARGAQNDVDHPLDGQVEQLAGTEGVPLQVEGAVDSHLADGLDFRGRTQKLGDAQAQLYAVVHQLVVERLVHRGGIHQHEHLVGVQGRAQRYDAARRGSGTVEECSLLGCVDQAEPDHPGGLHVVGVGQLLGLLGGIARGDEHESFDAIGGAPAPMGEQEALVEVLEQQRQQDVDAVGDHEHLTGIVLADLEEVEDDADDEEARERDLELGADVLPVAAAEDAAVGVGDKGDDEVDAEHEDEQPPPRWRFNEGEVAELDEVGAGEGRGQRCHVDDDEVRMLRYAGDAQEPVLATKMSIKPNKP